MSLLLGMMAANTAGSAVGPEERRVGSTAVASRTWLADGSGGGSALYLGFDAGDETIHRLFAHIDHLRPAAGDDRHVGDADDLEDEAEILGRDVTVADRRPSV